MVKDFSRYAFFTVCNLVAGYALLWFLANQLSKADYAQYGWYTTLFAIAVIFYNVGHRDALFKLSSQRADGLGRFIATSVVCLAIAFIFLLFSFPFEPMLLISGVGFLLLHLLNITSAVHRGLGCYQKDALAMPLYRVFWLLGCIALVFFADELSIYSVFVIAAISAGLAFLVVGGVATLTKYIDFRRMQFPLSNATIKHFFIIELVTISFIKLDIPLLKWHGANDSLLSDYFFSFQLFEAGILLLAPVSYLLFNQLNKSDTLVQKPSIAIKAVLMIIVLVMCGNLGWMLLGEWFLQVLFPKYLSANHLVSLFLVILLPNALNMLLAHALFSVHMEKAYIQAVAIGLGVLLLCNFIELDSLIQYSVIWSRLIAEITIFCCLAFVCFKHRQVIFKRP